MGFRIHLYIFGGMLVGCLLIGNPLSLVYLAILPLGLGLIVALVLINGTFYYALMLPGFFLDKTTRASPIAGLRGTLLIFAIPACVALLAPVASLALTEWSILRATMGDADGEPVGVAGGVAGGGSVSIYADKSLRVGKSVLPACSPLCQRLLANGIADRVVMVSRPGKRRSPPAAMTYVLRKRTHCAGILPSNENPVTELLERRAAGECLVGWQATSPEREADGLFVDIEHVRRGETGLHGVAALKRLRIGRRTNGEIAELFAKTHVTTERLSFPLYFAIRFGGPHGFPTGWQFAKQTRETNAFDSDTLALGLLAGQTPAMVPAEPQRRRPADATHAEMTAALKRLVDSPQSEVFEPSLSNVVVTWVNSRGRNRGPEFQDLLVQIASDRRFIDVPQVFSALDPDGLRRALPVLIGRLENPPAAEPELEKKRRSFDFDRSSIAYALRRLEPADLAPYADRLMALASRPGEKWTAGIIAILPKLDRDSVRVLEQALQSDRWETRRRAAQSACLARPEVQQALKPALMRAWSHKSGDARRAIARALIRMGEKDAVERGLKSERERLSVMFVRGRALEAGFDPRYCTN